MGFPVGTYAPVLLCALDAVGCMCESACICERLCIRADFVKLANRVIEHKSTRRVRVWLLLFVCGGLFFVAGVPWVSGKTSATLSSRDHVIGFCMHARAHTAKMRISARRYACLLSRLLLPPAAAALHICCRCLLCEHQARGRSDFLLWTLAGLVALRSTNPPCFT